MKLFFSGSTSGESLPEHVLKDWNDGPAVMLTFYEIDDARGDATKRMERHVGRLRKKKGKRRGKNRSSRKPA